MVLQASGVITLSDIRGEFGGTAPDLLSEYYRGGGLVPDTPANAGIPTSGAIKLSDFYGGDASVGSVEVTSPVIADYHNAGLVCGAGVAFQPNGKLDLVGPAATDRTLNNAGEWWSEEPVTDIGASYDVRCASISESTGGTGWNIQAEIVGTWIDMSVERVWRVNVIAMNSPDLRRVVASFEIRPAGGGTTLATFSVTCEASN